MQVKKFEAPTIQEALDTIKRELGPEAIILQTKKNKRGFGLMSKPSVEVTAAVSERSMQKKKYVENRLPDQNKETLKKMAAPRQADLLDKYGEKQLEKAAQRMKDRVEVSRKAAGAMVNAANAAQSRQITATRYIDIQDDAGKVGKRPVAEEQEAPKAASLGKQGMGLAQRTLGTSAEDAPLNPLKAAPGMTMEEELRHLKRMIEEMKSAQDEGAPAAGPQALMGTSTLATPALQDCFEQMIVNGMDKRYALALAKKVAFELGSERALDPDAVADQMAMELMETSEVTSPLNGLEPAEGKGPVILALVGPTGVGKTTTVAKMASEALLKRNLKVGLINLDSYKVAAFDQLGTYAKILSVPFRSVATVEDLKAAISDFQGLDLVLIDTTGRSQRDPAALKEMQAMLTAVPTLRTQLVLSVTTRDTELYDMVSRFSMYKPEGLIFSKLDEATTYGAIYNVSQKAKLPLLYFTTGQRVPEDIEEATRERMAALILNL